MKKLVILACTLLLNACGPVYKTEKLYVQPNTRAGDVCIQKCKNTRSECQADSRRKYDTCMLEQNRVATQMYEDYIRESINRDQLPDKDVTSKTYLDETKCRHYKNNYCDADYDSCFVACGGNIDIKRFCVRNCERIQS